MDFSIYSRSAEKKIHIFFLEKDRFPPESGVFSHRAVWVYRRLTSFVIQNYAENSNKFRKVELKTQNFRAARAVIDIS